MTRTAGYPQRTPPRPAPDLSPRHEPAASVSLPQEIRRRQARFAADALHVQSPIWGAAVEISAAGMRLESCSDLAVGCDYVFRLAYGARFLNLPGRVAWCRLHRIEVTARSARRIYQAGIELRGGKLDRSWRAALAHRAGVAVGA